MGLLDFLFRRSSLAPAPSVARPVVYPFADRRARRDIAWRRLLDSLEHPFELVSGADAQAAFEAAQVLGRTQGFSPLIVQPGFDGLIQTGPMSLKDAKVRMPSEYFAQRAGELAEDTDELALFDDVDEVEAEDTSEQLYVIDFLSETRPVSPYAEVALVRLPCAESWKIPTFVRFGPLLDRSGATRGEEIGIEKDWYERFGAELCCVGPRSWQFRVARPPRDHRAAVDLLRQHYLYAWVEDAYDHEHIENGAASLRVATYWWFNWA